ncbi:MAG: flagellar biosynthesis anti-sigma factor FlgM [Deltaproteobacteria bacterium]|nr:flagellar biosynthesis anti-sigma factor FlgM [Deltaproteobacteria bacterium]
MKIDEISKQIGLISPAADSASRANAGGSQTGKPESAETRESAAKIELSKASVEYQKIAEAAQTDQTGRIERVNQLREALENDQYEIDSSQVADRMVLEGLMDVLKP